MSHDMRQWLRENQRPNEDYAGLIIGRGNEPTYHLFLLPDECVRPDWDTAMVWALKTKKAQLPNRRELALLRANLADKFHPVMYWASEQFGTDDRFAWGQDFHDGMQTYRNKRTEGRAKAVRRVMIDAQSGEKQ